MYDQDFVIHSTQGRKLTEAEMARSLRSRANEAQRDYDDSFNRDVSSREMNVEEHLRGSKITNPLQSSIELESGQHPVKEVEQEINTAETAINTILEMRHISVLLERSKELQQAEEEIKEQKRQSRNKQY